MANTMLALGGGLAALLIKVTGDPKRVQWRTVIADIAGTLALYYLAFLGLVGWGDVHVYLAVSLAGLAAAAGWATVIGVLKRVAEKRVG